MGGERRLEGDTYLLGGYGIRLALQAQPAGWGPLSGLAKVWQPSRLKGIQVGPTYGTPFLAATQVLDLRPVPRKFLALDQIKAPAELFVTSGQIVVTRSGNVGRAALALKAHEKLLISDDLLRVAPLDAAHWGWLYAYLRTPQARAMMSAIQYGHVIKHLEVAHLGALPVPDIGAARREVFNAQVQQVLDARDRSFELMKEAEAQYAALFPSLEVASDKVLGFTASATEVFGRRARLEASCYLPSVRSITAAYHRHTDKVVPLSAVTSRVFVPGRFKHVYGAGGTPYIDSADLLEINPDITKYVLFLSAKEQAEYHVEEGWLLIPCSGQVYGNIGHSVLATKWHTQKMLTNHALRVAPNEQIRGGYLQCVIGHPQIGRPQLVRSAFGSSVPEIAAADVATIPIPRFGPSIENDLADLMEESASLRAEADQLENALTATAEALLDRFIAGVAAALG
ncbi:MAG: hypothetical protein H7Z21_05330 [Hymenobacter sp.]|nr:hypothetical protein [Hymenobacter sp.]